MTVTALRLLQHFVLRNDNGAPLAMTVKVFDLDKPRNDNWNSAF